VFFYVPRWLLPGTVGAKVSFLVSLLIAAVIAVEAWGPHTARSASVIVTVLLVLFVTFNFVTQVLARGPYASRLLAAARERGEI
jgi:hypothetical protein